MRQLKITQTITTRESISLNKYLADIGSIPLLTKEEEENLPLKIKEGDEAAFTRFVGGNLRFVVSVAKQYQGSGERLDDLINAGNLGLMVAAKRFDTSRGFKFISYGVWWIRQAIMQHLTENSKSIRLPANKITLVNKIKRVTSILEQQLHRPPTMEEIGEKLLEDGEKITGSDVDQMLSIHATPSSLDMKIREDSETSLMDLITAESLEDVNQTLTHQDLQFTLKRLFQKRLTIREREIVIMLFGLFGEKQMSLEEIGIKFELTRERVRQIKEKALRKLRHTTTNKEVREYLN